MIFFACSVYLLVGWGRGEIEGKMENKEKYTGFEQGPIRPPSEASSLLIRITRNCSWNRCSFCPVYKGEKFSLRPVDHVLRDIDAVRFYTNALLNEGGIEGVVSRHQLEKLSMADGRRDIQALYAAISFVQGGMKSIFLQDGNSLILKAEHLIRILQHLKESFPGVERITSYARSSTIVKIGEENLQEMALAGLNRVHIGMESGSDKVLEMVQKGTDKSRQITAGKMVKKAGIELSEYYMPGLGGRKLSRENALETADALNQINPDFIRLRTLALPSLAPLTQQFQAGKFDKMGEVETAHELLLFLESLTAITSTIKSDHVLNLFPEIDGILPQDREKVITPVKAYLALDPQEQMLFSIARRTHRLSSLSDLNVPSLRHNALQICNQLGATPDNMDDIIDNLMKQFI